MADGLPQDNVVSIAQTPDGYLWLGTEEGLARFDGLRFTIFDKSNTPELKSNDIYALLVDRTGNLWIGTGGGGVLRMTQGKFVAFTTQNGLSNDSVLSLCEERDHAIWIGTEGGGVNRFKDGKFTVYNSKTGLADDSVYSISGGEGWKCMVRNGWRAFATEGWLLPQLHRPTRPSQQERARPVRGSRRNPLGGNQRRRPLPVSGRAFQNLHHQGRLDQQCGVFRLPGQRRKPLDRHLRGRTESLEQRQIYSLSKPLPAPRSDDVWAFLQDREGSLWIGSDDGLSQLRDGQVTTYSSAEGLSSDIVLPIYEDREGSLWMGTAGGGLNRFRNGQFTSYTTRQGLSDSFVLSLTEDQEGALWVGTRHGLDRMKDGKFTVYTTKDGLPNDIVFCMWPDRDGNVWFGTRSGLGRYKDGKFTTYTTKDGLSNNYVTFIYQDHDGTLWVGTGGGGLNRYKERDVYGLHHQGWLIQRHASPPSTKTRMEFCGWGPAVGGLNRFNGGKFTSITMKDGLYDDKIFQILEDRNHNFWMSSNRGIFRASEQQLNDFADGKITSIQSVSYGVAEGMKSRECNGGFQPAGWTARDGKAVVPHDERRGGDRPRQFRAAGLPPEVRVEAVVVDQQSFAPGEAIQHRARRWQAGVSLHRHQLAAAKRVDFKYKLEGFDQRLGGGRLPARGLLHQPPSRTLSLSGDGGG